MVKQKRFWMVSGVLLIAALGLMAFSIAPSVASSFDAHRGGPGGFGEAQYLAEALGISTDELAAAQEQANQALIDQLIEAGWLTEKQAEWLQNRSGRLPFGLGDWAREAATDLVDRQALLAEALGISVEELQAAQEQALELGLEDAVANGQLTAEQAELLKAQRALKTYIDRETLTAQALGISVEELQAARADGQTMTQLLAELDLTVEEFRTALQAAHEAAIQQAVADGVITAEQAEALQNFAPGRAPGLDGRGGRGGRGGEFRPFPGGGQDALPQPEDAPTSGNIL